MKKRGLGKVYPLGKPIKKNKSVKKKKPKKKKPVKKKSHRTKMRKNFTISQPRKKRYTVHAPRLINNKPRSHFKSFISTDSSSYSNIMGEENFKRTMRRKKNVDGKISGFGLDQNNDDIRIFKLK